MSEPKITIFTCSYNKPLYILDAIGSVLNQTFTNFEYVILENSNDGRTRDIVHSVKDNRIKVIDIDFSDYERKKFYVESVLKNLYSPVAHGKFIMYLADDDTLEPTCFEEHLKEFERDKTQMVNFHGYRVVYLGTETPEEVRPATRKYGYNTRCRPGVNVDGGTVMFKKELLGEIEKLDVHPLFKLWWPDAHISDGLFLNKMAQIATLYPINKILSIKRITEISTHSFVNKNGQVADHRSGKIQ